MLTGGLALGAHPPIIRIKEIKVKKTKNGKV
jgi:hypothetical protein